MERQSSTGAKTKTNCICQKATTKSTEIIPCGITDRKGRKSVTANSETLVKFQPSDGRNHHTGQNPHWNLRNGHTGTLETWNHRNLPEPAGSGTGSRANLNLHGDPLATAVGDSTLRYKTRPLKQTSRNTSALCRLLSDVLHHAPTPRTLL